MAPAASKASRAIAHPLNNALSILTACASEMQTVKQSEILALLSSMYPGASFMTPPPVPQFYYYKMGLQH